MSDGPNDYTHSDEVNAARLAKAQQLDKEIADAKKQLEDSLGKLESVKKEIKEINQFKSKGKRNVKFADKLTDQPSIEKNTAGTRKNKKRTRKHSRKHNIKKGKKTRRHRSKRYK